MRPQNSRVMTQMVYLSTLFQSDDSQGYPVDRLPIRQSLSPQGVFLRCPAEGGESSTADSVLRGRPTQWGSPAGSIHTPVESALRSLMVVV